MTTTATNLGYVIAAVKAASNHPELPLPNQFEGLDYWPTDQAQAAQIRVALDEVFDGKLTWTSETSQHSRHILLRAYADEHRVFTIWIPDPA